MFHLGGKICDVDDSQHCNMVELSLVADKSFFEESSKEDIAQIWSVAFSSLMFFYFLGVVVGRVLAFIKNEGR